MEPFLISVMIAATPFLFAATGELVAERSGVLNLGLEGMMLMGAVTAFAVAFSGGGAALAALAGAAAGAGMALIFAVLALGLMANQAATGLALTIFGVGASGLVGQPFIGQPLPGLPRLSIPGVTDATMLTRILLQHDAMVWLALFTAAAVAWFLSRSRAGLALRAVGDNAASAHALGLSVMATRYAATLFGGAMAGLGGAYLSLAYTPMWGENMTAGRGWIALALVVFATWRPGRVVAGAYLFAAVTQAQFYGQGAGFGVPNQVLAMAPYLATIVALVIISRDRMLTRANAPACLGKPFRADR
ncbi:MAG: ABC transporter permease [Rubrimonas sp.]